MSTYNLLNGYVGSKAPYISKIKALFDDSCTKYIEPYCGGAGVYFSNYNGKYEKEWINDSNLNIAILYKSLTKPETREDTIKALLDIKKPDDFGTAQTQFQRAKKEMLKLSADSQLHYSNSGEWLNDDVMVKVARNTFLAYSQSFNCSAASYSKNKSDEKYRYEVRRNLANVMERLKTKPHVTCFDGLEIIKRFSGQPEIQFLIDWPYVGLYRRRSKLYQSEMADLYSHMIGAIALSHSKAAVVMCGYRSPREEIPTIYDAVLTGEEWRCFKIADAPSQCMVVKAGEKKAKATEYVWTNRVPERAGLYVSLHDYKEKMTLSEYWEKIYEAGRTGMLPPDEMLEYEYTYKKFFKKGLFNTKDTERAIKEVKNRHMKEKLILLTNELAFRNSESMDNVIN